MFDRLTCSLGFCLIVWSCGGCAHTRITSFVDPDFRDKTYRRLLVRAQYDDLEQRGETETRLVEALDRTAAEGIVSTDVLPPTREHTDAELFDLLEQSDIDAVLLVTETDYYEELEYIPPSSTTTASHYFTARTFYHGRRRTTHRTGRTFVHTRRSGGYYVSSPRVRHELTLYDRRSRRMAWIATALTEGDSQSRFEDLVGALADKAVETLVKDGLVPTGARHE